MDNTVKHDNNSSNFFVELNGKESKLKYRMRGNDTIEMFSTYVPEEHRGKGIASKMAEAALSYARENNFKVVPTCSFVQDYIKRNEEYQDLL